MFHVWDGPSEEDRDSLEKYDRSHDDCKNRQWFEPTVRDPLWTDRWHLLGDPFELGSYIR
jgi:hypothetical protein